VFRSCSPEQLHGGTVACQAITEFSIGWAPQHSRNQNQSVAHLVLAYLAVEVCRLDSWPLCRQRCYRCPPRSPHRPDPHRFGVGQRTLPSLLGSQGKACVSRCGCAFCGTWEGICIACHGPILISRNSELAIP
jgi:hypothetical protein